MSNPSPLLRLDHEKNLQLARAARGSTSAPIGFHVTMRLEDDRPVATSVADLRAIARIVNEQGDRRELLDFGTADNHLHSALATDRDSAGAFARHVESGLRQALRLGSRFRTASIRPIHDQQHAYNTFWYLLRQDSHHGLPREWALEGSSLPDLLGLRALPISVVGRMRARLPRVRPAAIAALYPPGVFVQRPIDLGVLADAAAAALALPDLQGRSLDVVRARRAAVHVAGPDVPSRKLSDCLGLGLRSIRGLRELPPEPLVVRAVWLQALSRTPVG